MIISKLIAAKNMSESARRTKSEHNKKRIGLAGTTVAAAAIMMMLYAVPTQQQQFAAALIADPGPIIDEDIEQEIEDIIARLSNLQQEVEDERARVILAGLINVLEDTRARLLPPSPPAPGAPEYCYDYSTDTGVESVCYTTRQACENDRVADPREVISTECYERQPEN